MKNLIFKSVIYVCCLIFFCSENITQSNKLPICRICSPLNNMIFIKGDLININIKVSERPGIIKKVKLYIDSNLVHICGKPPYEYGLNSAALDTGSHRLTAVACDNQDDSTTDVINFYLIDPTPFDYHGLPNYTYNCLLKENFNNNFKGWYEGSYSNFKAKIDNGCYEISNYDHKVPCVSLYNFPTINSNNNFQIESEIKILQDSSGYGLLWGANLQRQSYKYFSYYLYYELGLRIIDQSDTIRIIWYGWKYNDSIKKPKVYNKFTIRKYNQKYYFFLNEKIICQKRFKSFYGTQLGFYVYPQTIVRINLLNVYQLKDFDRPGLKNFTIEQKVLANRLKK